MKTKIILTLLFTMTMFSQSLWHEEPVKATAVSHQEAQPVTRTTVRARAVSNYEVSRSRKTQTAIVKRYARWYAKTKYGYTNKQFAKVSAIWEQESHWNWTAENERSGAWGIAQMLMDTKVKSPFRQVELGFKYIKHRYGTPDEAYRVKMKTGTY